MNLTAVEIPCCLCGTLILPNAANQCATCLAQSIDLARRVQRGPGGGDLLVHQCRQCRRYARSVSNYQPAEPESPELLSICLSHIPALQKGGNASGQPDLHLVDASWIWTEPHSMRFQLRLTIRTEVLNVPVQQRVAVELKCQFRQCSDCNREYSNRTWHACVQLRQHRGDETSSKRGLVRLEQALAKNAAVRRYVLSMDNSRHGFDFYFLTLSHAQAFVAYLQKVLGAMRCKTTRKMVSQDNHNNSANMKYTLTCDLVPLCKDDLVLVDKSFAGKLAGQLALVTQVSSVITLVAAAPRRGSAVADNFMELSAEAYYKHEKLFRVLQTPKNATTFVVLDVEGCVGRADADAEAAAPANDMASYAGPQSGVTKYALADVDLAREADMGASDDMTACVTHMGHLLQPGDLVRGYDLERTIGGDWELDTRLQHQFVMPDVVLFKKTAGGGGNGSRDDQIEVNAKTSFPGRPSHRSKRKERKQRKENRRARELEESAVRMGFLEDFDAESEDDVAIAAELEALEQQFVALESLPSSRPARENEGDHDQDAS